MRSRAEGSSKIHSRMEQQTSRLGQQMKSNSSSSGSSGGGSKSLAASKSSPPKGKTSPTSPLDDIEKGGNFCLPTYLLAFIIYPVTDLPKNVCYVMQFNDGCCHMQS